MYLGSRVWDASATMIDVPLENAINMRSVWTAWFQFWAKHLLHIDVLFFRNILNVQHRIEWVQLDRLKKKVLQNETSLHRILCAKLPDRHLKFDCSVLHSNVDFYFKFDEYTKFEFVLTPWIQTTVTIQQIHTILILTSKNKIKICHSIYRYYIQCLYTYYIIFTREKYT